MPDRYYSAEPIEGTTATLDGSEAHHLLHVMRAKPGLDLTIFDGCGGEFAAEVTDCKRATVEVRVGERQAIERELDCEITLAVALPKGDRQRWLIEKCVELGVSRVVPLQHLARSASKGNPKKEHAPEKLTRYVIEASKQCGRNRLMEIATPMRWNEVLDSATTGLRIVAHPGGKQLTEMQPTDDTDQTVLIAVGPEGGFTDEEVTQAVDAGWAKVGLGERILRIETAALAMVSKLA